MPQERPLQAPQISKKDSPPEAMAFSALELNKQCMASILCAILTIEKELFAITDILAGQVSESK